MRDSSWTHCEAVGRVPTRPAPRQALLPHRRDKGPAIREMILFTGPAAGIVAAP